MMEKVIEIIKEVMQENDKKINVEIKGSTSLRGELEFASLDLAILTVKIEDEFDIDIFEDGIVDTVDEIVSKLS